MKPYVIGPESPIRVFSRALDVRQRMFLDGIQIAVGSLQVAYARLTVG